MGGAIEYNLGEEVYGPETEMGGLDFNAMTGGTMVSQATQDEMKPDQQEIVDTRFRTGDEVFQQAEAQDRELTEEMLREDPQFIESSKVLANFLGDNMQANEPSNAPSTIQPEEGTATKQDFDVTSMQATDDQYAGEYGLQIGAEMQGNIGGFAIGQDRALGGLAPIIEQAISSGDEEVLKSIKYILDKYEEKPMTIDGTLKTSKYMFGDVSNYLGVTALVSAPMKLAGKNAIGRGVRAKLTQKLASMSVAKKASAIGAGEGAFYGFMDSLEKQRLSVATGDQTSINLDDLAIDTAISGTAGAVLAGSIAMTPAMYKASKKGIKDFYQAVKDEVNSGKAKYVDPDGNPIEGEPGGTGADEAIKKGNEDEKARNGSGSKQEEVHGETGTDVQTQREGGGNKRTGTEDSLRVLLEPAQGVKTFEKTGDSYKMTDERSALLEKERGTTPVTINEVTDVDEFHKNITEAKTGKNGPAVYVYPKEEYADMRLFQTEDGSAGFALKPDGDIVSVFKKDSSELKRVTDHMIPLAIQEGGTKLDAYDTVLPKLYQPYGLQTTKTDAWDDQYMPDDWDKDVMGTPGVAYMDVNPEAQQKFINNNRVDSVLAEADKLEGKAKQKKLNTIDMRDLTPENKQKVIDYRKASTPKKVKTAPVEKAIKVQEDFNEGLYSVLANEVAHLDMGMTYRGKEFDKIFAGVKKSEMKASGMAELLEKNPEGLTGQALQDQIDNRPDKINKRIIDNDTEGVESVMDQDDWESERISEEGWDNAPNWVESETGTAYKIADNETGNDGYVMENYDDDSFVDVDGDDVGNYDEMQEAWYDDFAEMSDYNDEIMEVIEGDDATAQTVMMDTQRLMDREIDRLDALIAKTGGDKPTLQATRDELEAISAKVDDAYENDKEQEWIKEAYDSHSKYVIEGAKGDDDIKDAILTRAKDDAPWYDVYSSKVYYYNEAGDHFDNLEDAVQATKDNMFVDYEATLDPYSNDVIDLHEKYTIGKSGSHSAVSNYRVGIYEMPAFDPGEKSAHFADSHWGSIEGEGKNIQVHTRLDDWEDMSGKDGTIVGEVQDDWEQEFTAGGGEGDSVTPAQKAEMQTKLDDIKAQIAKQEEVYKAGDEELKTAVVNEEVMRQKHRKIFDEKHSFSEKRNAINAQRKAREDMRVSQIEKKDAGEIDQREFNDSMVKYDEDTDYASSREVAIDELQSLAEQWERELEEIPEWKELDNIVREFKKIQSETMVAGRRLLQDKRDLDSQMFPKQSEYATPPMKRQQYEKLAIHDTLMEAIDDGKDFYGTANGHTSNGWDITNKPEEGGIITAYDIEIPAMLQEMSGQTPYRAYYNGMVPKPEDRFYWDKPANMPQTSKSAKGTPMPNYTEGEKPLDWYWRIDLTDEVKSKMKDGKIPLYEVGGLTLGGAVMGAVDEQNDEEF